ncbi:MAG: acyclic terpene utilization AtuA family protein [Actinomycetota bacterium]
MLRIANCSGFLGDRLSAAREMVEGGPIDVLTGDYLAELTMAILWRSRRRDPNLGYAGTFLVQMKEVLGTCVERGIRIVANAGGLNPAGLAEALKELAGDLGVNPRIAHVDGDDLIPRLNGLAVEGHQFSHLDRKVPLTGSGVTPLTANAYLGGWAIKEALELGAEVVVTGRVTDAALVVGPSAWRFGWSRDDWDALAGAVVAGHIIECGPQATGGNYCFLEEVPGLAHVGFPIAEMYPDGSAVITKHPGTGGLVSVGTVTAQLLYEIGPPHYLNPDATADFETIRLDQIAPDRVKVTGVKGSAPPPDLKVALNYAGGYRNSVTFGIAGLDVEKKVVLLEEALWEQVGGREQYAETDVRLYRGDRPDPETVDQSIAYLKVTVKGPDDAVISRFSRAVVELALAHYPGFFITAPPLDATPYAVYWPSTIPARLVPARVTFEGVSREVSSVVPPGPPTPQSGPSSASPGPSPFENEATVRVPLGVVAGARSGDKGGNANLGVWVRSEEAYRWLRSYLTVARLRLLVPETHGLSVDRFELGNLLAINFVIMGLLGEGVSSSVRTDPQAKSLGEFLRARLVDIPRSLVDASLVGDTDR